MDPQFLIADTGQLLLQQDNGTCRVDLIPCFPWSNKHGDLSVRDAKGDEVFYIDTMDDLEASSQEAIQSWLDREHFVHEISAIDAIERQFELTHWQVQTQRGRRHLQTPIDYWPTTLKSGALLIEDVNGDMFHISDPKKLDRTSQQLLWAYQE